MRLKYMVPIVLGAVVLVAALVLRRTPSTAVSPPVVASGPEVAEAPKPPPDLPPDQMAAAADKTRVRGLVSDALSAAVRKDARTREAAVVALRASSEVARQIISEERMKAKSPEEVRLLTDLSLEVAR